MNGVLINGKHSLEDFGFYLQPKSIPLPSSKVNVIPINGADGEIDLSTALTDGNIHYSNRNIELVFVCIGYGSTLDAKIEEFVTAIHGKKVELIFDDDQDHYFVGRCEVTERDYQKGYTVISCEVNAEPFRYEVDITKVAKVVDGETVMIVSNSRQWVVPSITASAEMTLMYQGTLYRVLEGTHVNDNIVLRDGENLLTFSGEGTVIIEYRQGVL